MTEVLKNQESPNLLTTLTYEAQFKLIGAMNQFLGATDLILTPDPYFKLSCTIDQKGNLVLIKNSVQLSWIDLKGLWTKPLQAEVLKILSGILGRDQAKIVLENIAKQLYLNFSECSNHQLGDYDAFSAYEDNNLSKQDKIVLSYINHMMGDTRTEYFSMKNKENNNVSTLYINEKGCKYMSRILSDFVIYIHAQKGFMNLEHLFSENKNVLSILEKLQRKEVLSDQEIVAFFTSVYRGARTTTDMEKKGKLGLLNDLVFACHYVYHKNNYAFYDLQLKSKLDTYKSTLQNAILGIQEKYNKNLQDGEYILFHDIAPLKGLPSCALKSLRGTDIFKDIWRGRTVLNLTFFDRKGENKDALILDIASVFQGVESSIYETCKAMGMKNITITKEFDNKYNDLKTNSSQISQKAFGGDFQRKKKDKKDIPYNAGMLGTVKNALGDETITNETILDIYTALQDQRKGSIDGYEDMKTIFTIKGTDTYGNIIEFGYEHMLVFSDYSNEHPKASHTAKLDPYKIVASLTKDMAITSQQEFYDIMVSGLQDLVGQQKAQKEFLDDQENKNKLFQGTYPYTYVQEQFAMNDVYTLDDGTKMQLSNLELPRDKKIFDIYIAQAFEEFCRQGKFHLFVRNEDKSHDIKPIEELKNTNSFNSMLGEKQGNIYVGDANCIKDVVLALDSAKLGLMQQTLGNLRRQLVTGTISNDANVGVCLGEQIYWIPVHLASYMFRMLELEADDKMYIDFATGNILPYINPTKNLTNDT